MPTMGAALEAVPLRSTLPTGRMTMRYQMPMWDDAAYERRATVPTTATTSTTPKVSVATSVPVDVPGETAARKGGEAR